MSFALGRGQEGRTRFPHSVENQEMEPIPQCRPVSPTNLTDGRDGSGMSTPLFARFNFCGFVNTHATPLCSSGSALQADFTSSVTVSHPVLRGRTSRFQPAGRESRIPSGFEREAPSSPEHRLGRLQAFRVGIDRHEYPFPG